MSNGARLVIAAINGNAIAYGLASCAHPSRRIRFPRCGCTAVHACGSKGKQVWKQALLEGGREGCAPGGQTQFWKF